MIHGVQLSGHYHKTQHTIEKMPIANVDYNFNIEQIRFFSISHYISCVLIYRQEPP